MLQNLSISVKIKFMNYNKISKILLVAILIVVSFLAGTYSTDKASIEKKGYDAGYSVAWDKATNWNLAKMEIFTSMAKN